MELWTFHSDRRQIHKLFILTESKFTNFKDLSWIIHFFAHFHGLENSWPFSPNFEWPSKTIRTLCAQWQHTKWHSHHILDCTGQRHWAWQHHCTWKHHCKPQHHNGLCTVPSEWQWLTRDAAAKFVWEFWDEVIVDSVLQWSKNNDWPCVLHCNETTDSEVQVRVVTDNSVA